MQRVDVPSAVRTRTWLVWIGIVALLAWAGMHARFSEDLQALLPDNDPELNHLLAFLKGRSASRLLAVESRCEAERPEAARQALLDLVPTLSSLGAKPLAQPAPESVLRLLSQVRAHLSVLLTPQQLAQVRARLSPAALTQRLREIKEQGLRPDDALGASAARSDLLSLVSIPVSHLVAQANGYGVADGIIAHRDGQHFMLPLAVDFDPGEVQRTHALMTALTQAAVRAKAQGVRLDVIGSYRHYDDNISSLYHDFAATIPVALGLIALLLYSLARSWRAVLAMHLPAVVGLGAAVAAIALCGGVVPVPLIGFAATLLGVAVDYGIQMAVALRAGRGDSVTKPLLRSCVISLCAFLALSASPVPALRALGIMVIGGLLAAYCCARWLLPTVVVARQLARDPWAGATGPLLAWCEGPAWRNITVLLILSAILIPGLPRLHTLVDVQSMDGSRAETRDSQEAFFARWGALETANFLVAGMPTLDEALTRLAQARARMALGPSSLEQFLPSAVEAQRRRAAWDQLWQEQAPLLPAALATACTSLGLRVHAFDASLDLYRPVRGATPIPALADWKDTSLGPVLAGLVSHQDEGHGETGLWQVASPVDLTAPADIAELPHRLAESGETGVWAVTRRHVAERLVAVLVDDLGRRALFIALGVCLAVAVLVRDLRTSLAMLLPPALALLWTFGLLGWLGIALTPFSVLVAAFVAGIGIDCAVFLAERRERDHLVSPVIACVATAICATGALLIARHPLLAGVGGTLTIGMSTCLVACLLLTPVLARRRGGGA